MSSAWRGAAITAALVMGVACMARAEESPGAMEMAQDPFFKVRGFGTAALTHSSDKNADFITSVYQPNGAGHTRNPDYGVDSRVGVQGDFRFASFLTGVVQILSERQYDGTWRPVLEWANLSFKVTPDLSFRLGRVALPVFMESDTRKVGFAQTWVRPPVDMYSLCPMTANNGIDGIYRMHMGEVNLTLQAAYGTVDMHRPITREYSGEDKSSAFRADKGKLVNLMFEYQSLTVRANYTTQQMYIEGKPVDALFDGMRGFAGQLAPAIPSTAQTIRNLADTYEAKDKKTSLVSAGAIYDPGSWLIQGEWTRRTSDSFLADETAWYLNGGYRFGHFTPYIGLSAVKCDSERKSTGIPLTGLTGVALGTAMYLNTALDGLLLKAAEDQKSWTAGVRWDFMRNLDLKLQFDRVLPQHNSNGTFTVPPGVVRQKNRAATIVTAAIDFVF